MPQQTNHYSEEQLGDGDRIAGGGVDHGDAERRRCFEGDVVDADTGTTHDLQLLGCAQQLLGDARRAAADQCVVIADARQKLLLRQRRHFVYAQLRLSDEQLDAFRVDVVGNENVETHDVGAKTAEHAGGKPSAKCRYFEDA